jgi:hypothetical protein
VKLSLRLRTVTSVLLLAVAPAEAEVATMTIDHVAIGPGGAHSVWVSVLDGAGRPLLNQQPAQFSVEEDLIPAPDVEVMPYGRRYSGVELTVIVDPNLLAGSSAASLAAMLRSLRERLAGGDRLRIVSAGEGFPSTEVVEDKDHTEIENRLESLGAASPPRILDAVLRELLRSRRLSRDKGSIVLLVTGSAADQSRAKILDVLALLRNRERPATVSLLLLGDAVPERDRDRLRRIVDDWTGGGTKLVGSAEALAQAGTELLERARGAYLLRFRPDDWAAQADRHSLRVVVRLGADQASAEKELVTADVVIAPWWAGPRVWLGVGVLLAVLLVGGALVTRQRCLCRLVVVSGDERGCSYEILKVPIKIGTMEGNDLILDEPRVSRNHALLDRRAGGFDLLDLNSENGTLINGDRITRHRLVRGDRIGIGAVVLRFNGAR